MNEAFGQRPARPNTEEFWKLSEMVLQFDGRMEATSSDAKDAVFEEMLRKYVGTEEVTYLAMQRAMRAIGIETRIELSMVMQEILRLSSCWIEAFIMGCEWATRQQERSI